MDLTGAAPFISGFSGTLRTALLAQQAAEELKRRKKYASLMEALLANVGGAKTTTMSDYLRSGGAEGA